MRAIQLDGPVDCAAFDCFCHAYLDDELGRPDREALGAHIDACPSCARLLHAESSFDRALRQRLAREPVPAGLEARIRAGLAADRIPSGRAAPPWRRHVAASVLAASVLLALATIPFLAGRIAGISPGRDDVVQVRREATVVDLVCDRRGLSYDRQRACRNPEHVNALRMADGSYWGILPSDAASRAGVLRPDERGHRVAVAGDYFPAIRSVAVASVEELAGVERRGPAAPAETSELATLLSGGPSRAPAKRGGA